VGKTGKKNSCAHHTKLLGTKQLSGDKISEGKNNSKVNASGLKLCIYVEDWNKMYYQIHEDSNIYQTNIGS